MPAFTATYFLAAQRCWSRSGRMCNDAHESNISRREVLNVGEHMVDRNNGRHRRLHSGQVGVCSAEKQLARDCQEAVIASSAPRPAFAVGILQDCLS